ncbi:hypothetical protein LTR70_007013 [Exophiala xenobiotica]|uniref:Uncharacterized protein n=1 Tax=Lithohypha guttulata TaxID=1690604 RepID=A0ABR0K520_9EURO|nr:hypothetical protein LTR24_006870 [Lithohypha guttulata]KAK5314714.1 hypothetical protein LTR70_007013 [Exophiala xenobiotica]
MRLRVTVQRHELPEVRHLFNTTAAHGPGKQRIETVAELVSAVNTVVPLESSDGEWGLEEYLVEVNDYECLHYQELQDVLRDDDEVVIRGLTTNEIKERRNGGRLQITADGRHLIDGVCWGRRFKPGFGRPEVYIPPRKKRRLLAEESNDPQLALPALHDAPPAVSEAIAFIDKKEYGGEDGEDDDEDDEEDEEYEDEEDADDDYESIADDLEDVEEEDEEANYEPDEDAMKLPTDDKRLLVNARTEDPRNLPSAPEETELRVDDVDTVDSDGELVTHGHQHRGRKRKRARAEELVIEVAKEIHTYDPQHPGSERKLARVEELLHQVAKDIEPSFAGFSSPAKLSQQEDAYPVVGTIEADHDIIHLGKHVVEQKKTTSSHHATSVAGSDSSDDEADAFQTNGTLEQPEYRAFEHRLLELRNGHASKSVRSSDNEAEEVQEKKTLRFANHSVKKKPSDPQDDDTLSSESDPSDDDDEDNGHATSSIRDRVQENQPDMEDTSSSGSDVDSDSDSSSAEDSSSEESSDSGESSSSSSTGDSLSSVESKKKATNGESLNKTSEENGTITNVQPPSNLAATQRQQQPTTLVPRQVVKVSAPPGQGQLKTKRNNERKKLNKVMKRLKEEGKVHENANFEELKAYLRGHGGEAPETGPLPESRAQVDAEADEMEARKAAIFQRLNAAASSEPEAANQAHPAAADATTVEQAEERPTEVTVTEETEQPTDPQLVAEASPVREDVFPEQPTEEPSPKRARLDMASSRRMVFNALGVRTPKTAAAEQALREKLAKPSRQVKAKEVKQQADTMSASAPLLKDASQHRWKKKLTVSAVECVSRHKHIEIPPFPFKHPWQVKKEKEEARKAGIPDTFLQYDDSVEDDKMQDMSEDEAMDDKQPSQSVITSRTLTAGDEPVDDDMPIPEKFDDLPVLKQTDLAEGAVVAYRQLHMNDRFEPEESPYRVARIIAKNGKELQLQLASKYRDPVDTQYDADTGERIYSKFDMPLSQGDHDEVDDGVRETSFDQLIRPKLVAPSETAKVFVAESQQLRPQASANGSTSNEPRLRGGFIEDSTTSRVAESQTTVDTPRRVEINDIIKEAGFDSALDEQLLQPLQEPEPVSAYGAQASEDREQEQPEDQVDETQNTTNHWSSSPNPVSSQFQALADSSAVRGSSVPSESIIESVRYPNLSQLGLDTPSLNVQSSSHQDAQRLTPTPAIDTSVMLKSPNLGEDNFPAVNNDQHDSLPSEVPQTQPEQQEEETESQDRGKSTRGQRKAGRASFAGLDGYVSAGEDSDAGPSEDDESLDSNGFPSLRALTSSQKSRNLAETEIEPERVRRSPRVNRSKNTGKPSESLWTDDESDSHTQKQVKASASQRDTRAARLSQIPEDTVVVDLTQSSPNEHSAKPVRSTARTGGGQASAFRRSFEGLGEKSFLKRKKRSL